jgi:outer membrane lipoprotein-sorting protein
MRRLVPLALVALVAAATLGLGGAGQPPPQRRFSFSDEQRADLDRISAALNAIHTMKGSFTQLDGNGGMAQGTFWLSKPGKIRFEYWPPTKLLVVSDGYSIAVRNNKLNTTDRYPLADSPLDFVLSDTLDLRNNPLIVGVEHQNGQVIVSARSAKNRMTGNITMVFSDPGLELRQWTIVDGQGTQTTVALRDVQNGIVIPGSTFVLTDENKFSKSGR